MSTAAPAPAASGEAGSVPSPGGAASWHALPAQDVLAGLESGSGGLSEEEAVRRLARCGPNALRAAPPASAWKILLAQLRSFVVLLLVAAAGLALATGDPLDAAAIAVVLLINTVLGFVMELRARRTMEGLLQLEVTHATVLRGGQRHEVGAERIVPGDVLVVVGGTRVPADARLLSGSELRTDESALTGESLPVEKDADARVPGDAPLADRRTMVYRSTLAVSGHAHAVVMATGMRTEVGRIGALVGGVREEPAPLERRLDSLGRRLAWVAVGAAVLVAVIGALRGTPAGLAVQTAIALAIAAVPEGLPAVATIALAVGVRRMARRHALVRRLPSVEALGSVTVVCTDKTGTLTAGEMTATRVWAGGREHAVTGAGYGPGGEIVLDGEAVRPREGGPLYAVLRIGVLANRSEVREHAGAWRVHGDPTEAALLVLARKAGVERAALLREAPEAGEVPFSSERMWMATFHPASSGGVEALVKGAPAVIVERCTRLLTEDGLVPLDDERRRAALAWNEAAAAEGLRVLALAYAPGVRAAREGEVEGLVLAGLVGMMDPPAAGVVETIARLRGAGLRTVMITGDQRATAVTVARGLGLLDDGDEALDGAEIDRLPDAELEARAGRVGVYSRVSPEAKLRIVSALRRAGEVVAMLGDGVNDAAALKRADIGVAMGIRGTDMAREAAGIVLQDDRFPTVAAAVEEGRIVFDNIRKFVFYLFSCNAAEVLVLLVAGAAGLPLPLLPLQILWMNIVTDTFPALALAVEPGERGVMRRPPRDPHAAILSRGFLLGVGFYGAMMTAATLVAFLWGLRTGDAARAMTLSFTTLGLAQILHLGNARSRGAVLGLRAATANVFALAAVALTVGLQLLALYLPPLQRLLGLVPPGLAEWMVVLPLAAAPAMVGQGIKWWRGRARLASSPADSA
ncbi:MAG TPA: HAD-IC family P-type ATPase [Longimicrobium sp.]|nr:HAD-IC family P-type ATPase [Longimicrobium sp.]